MANRYTKIGLVLSTGIFYLLLVFNNFTDYNSNFQYIAHVMSMDTTFSNNPNHWRSVQNPFFHHLFFWVIILTQTIASLLCLTGAWHLWKTRKEALAFQQAKKLATFGLGLGLILWFFCFIAIGGEWFLMWQSKGWNAQQSGFRLAALSALFLIYLNQQE